MNDFHTIGESIRANGRGARQNSIGNYKDHSGTIVRLISYETRGNDLKASKKEHF